MRKNFFWKAPAKVWSNLKAREQKKMKTPLCPSRKFGTHTHIKQVMIISTMHCFSHGKFSVSVVMFHSDLFHLAGVWKGTKCESQKLRSHAG